MAVSDDQQSVQAQNATSWLKRMELPAPLRASTLPQQIASAGPVYVEPEIFLSIVESQLKLNLRRGTLAYVEMIDHSDHSSATNKTDELALEKGLDHHGRLGIISSILNEHGVFSWFGNRYRIFIFKPNSFTARQILSKISYALAAQDRLIDQSGAHPTPAVGYVDLRTANSSRDMWAIAEEALERAKSSLEIAPFCYSRKEKRILAPGVLNHPLRFWRTAPQWVILLVQLAISLILGLAAPFILYAVCDALGADISGKVYIGVVIVLVITATTIWIEAILAVKGTSPPAELGSTCPLATVIIPAYLPNEADTILETLEAFLALEYPNVVQVIVAYNCPAPHMPIEDELIALAQREAQKGRFFIEPVRVSGSTSKAQNVNAVIGRVRGRFVGIFDADHHPRPDSLYRAWRWLSNGWDIVQGRCSVRNGEDTWVSRMVAVEFEQIYAVSHPGRARFHGFGIFGGSNGYWKTSVLHETRMRRSMLTEDIDSSIRALTAGYKIAGDRDLISEELAPTSIKQLLNQRLRWAQGWFQVSFRRVLPALISRKVTLRQKLGLCHLLIWRELFPWYSIQVLPIMVYWVWIYGWTYIHWTIPIFIATTLFTLSTGPGQIMLAYLLAEKSLKKKPIWFVEYFFVSLFFYSPFKDALSRVAHVKEGMRERNWKVTPRSAGGNVSRSPGAMTTAVAFLALMLFSSGSGWANSVKSSSSTQSTTQYIATLLGGEALTIASARTAALEGRHSDAARLFAKAIADLPQRRAELLPEYAENLQSAGRSKDAIPVYRELLASTLNASKRQFLNGQLAQALIDVRQYAQALTVYNGMLARDPTNVAIQLHQAQMLSRVGRSDAAVAVLEKLPADSWSKGPMAELGDQVLITAAESDARTGQRTTAKLLFERAFRHDAQLRAIYHSQYGALAPQNPGVANAPITSVGQQHLDQRQLAHSVPGSRQYLQLQGRLARELTSANLPDQALIAWNAYLRYAPADKTALDAKGELLSARNEHDQALESYKASVAHDSQDATARAGVLRETVFLARSAARDNRNIDAQKLFATAMTLDAGRTPELNREFADQLSFSGRAADAVPIYTRLLGGSGLSPVDRKRAMLGLANAYTWTDQLPNALAIYTKLADTEPGNANLQLAELTCRARIAARTDRNADAARLFANAIAMAPTQRIALLPEYADQLSYIGRSSEAIALYREVLAQPALASDQALKLGIGLAQVYATAGHYADAEAEYTTLIKANPHQSVLQRQLWVVSARDAAVHDRNDGSARLFAEAIRSDPAHSKVLLREYADQLSFSGHAADASAFYKAALKQPELSPSDKVAIARAQARALGWSGQYDAAAAIYDILIKSSPNDPTLRWQRLVLSAKVEARADQNDQAAMHLAEAIRLQPARRMEILKDYADQLTFSNQAGAAVPLYRELLLKSTDGAVHRDNTLALARALAWDHQLKNALNVYDQLIASKHDDVPAQLGAARTLSWMGHQDDARVAYKKILAAGPANAEALRGLAQVEDWDGRHFTAQALLRQRLAKDPGDVAARQLLAQSLVWSGRPDIAKTEVQLALRNRPAPAHPKSLTITSSIVVSPVANTSPGIYK